MNDRLGGAHGERDLARLLRELRPRLHDGAFVFARWHESATPPESAIGWFRELEGPSIVLPLADARARGLAFEGEMAWITLEVHSALDAVGLTAAVASALAAKGIACNVVAALRHDHLFVPVERGAEALRALRQLAADQTRVADDIH